MKAREPNFNDLIRSHGLPETVTNDKNCLYLPIARWLKEKKQSWMGPLFIGVNGAQGSGKTTFCALLSSVLRDEFELHAVSMSIDDIYHTREVRQRFGERIHPLCKLRGVPGTHDIELAHHVFDRARSTAPQTPLVIPRFDKATDDRKQESEWDVISTPIDIFLFEGWCVGCPPLPPWNGPYNERERREDPQGVWAKWSSSSLEEQHRALFARLDALIFIGVPSMETVLESRWLQEKKLWAQQQNSEQKGLMPGLMKKEEVIAYIALFERYTEHMLQVMPDTADAVIMRDSAFNYTLTKLPSTSTDSSSNQPTA